ncbi:MAG: hypothetical protein ACTHLT_01555 [Devosia sp.]
MTRLYLAAGVAAMAIAAPAAAGPGGHGGPHGGPQVQQQQQRGGGQQMRAQRQQAAPRMQAQRAERAPRMAMQAQRQERAAARPDRSQRMQQMQAQRAERQAARPDRTQRVQQAQAQRVERTQRAQQAQAQRVDRQAQMQQRMADRQQAQANRVNQMNDRMAARQQMQANRVAMQNAQGNRGQGYGVGGCPPGLASKGCMPPGLAAQQGLNTLRANRVAAAQSLAAQRSALALQRLDNVRSLAPVPLTLSGYSTPILPVGQAVQYVGQPLSALSTLGLAAMPSAMSYLYPTTPNYYYQYGNGYAYQVDRTSNLISALLPLLGGGYMPGQYLPSAYMSSYVPNYYGLNSFYPASYGSGYGYGYDNLCNRYANGVVYQVDCVTGMVQDVVPLYASGYGVGQMIPSSYDYYNVPYQYRSIYPASASNGYWYAPGAIYNYDRSSNLITSVASLLTPGLTIGQPLPMGYSTYNVPYDYRTQYVDTANDWYRYNNGYIYRVDPTTQLVSAIVASILT